MQAFLNRLRTQSQSRSIASGSSSSSSNVTPITPDTLNTNLDPAPPSSPTSLSQSQPPFTGLRKIHPNQDALLSSSPPPTPSGPPTSFQSPLSHQQQQQQPIDRPLSPPTSPRRYSGDNRKNNNKTVDVIRESNESDRPSLPSSIAGQFPETTLPDEEGRIRASGEEQATLLNEGNLSRSSSRKTTGLFGAVPFSGATSTGTGWSTFGRSQRRRQSTDDPVPLPVMGASVDSAKVSGDGVSRTSSQSKTTTPKTKSTNLSRSGSTKNPTQQGGGEHIYQPDVEQIEHYTRIPISSNPLTNTTLTNTTRIQSQAHDNNNNNDSSLSRSDSLSHSIQSPQQDSAPSTSSPHRTVFIDTADPNQKRQSRIAMEGTFPPRTTVVKPASDEGGGSPASLPFTFGRQSPTRPMAGELFDEFGSRPASQEQEEEESKPFPLVGTPTTEFPPSSITHSGSHDHNEKRAHLASDSSQPAPSLISDTNSETRHLGEGSSSVATLNTTGWSFGGALRGMPSFGSTGDELSHPRIVSEPSNEGLSSQIRDDGRRRRSSARRHSSGKLLPGKRSLGDLGIITAGMEPVVVMSAEVPGNSNSQAFPSQERISPEEEPVASTSTSRGHRRPTDDTTAVEPSTSAGQPLHIQPPEVSITGPTPRPSPARPHSDNRITSVVSTASTSTASPSTPTISRLTELFQRRAPEGYAHPSGVGVVGVGEPHSRRQSLKVMGKRKAGDSDSDAEGIVVFDERSNRPRTGSNAPSSYMRKRMKLSDASEKDAQPVRSAALAPTPSRSSRPSTTSRPKSIDSTRPRSISSNRPMSSLSRPQRPQSISARSNISIPISAIVSPRAPSIRHSIASTSRVPGGERMRYQDPLKNRVQRRRRTDVWAESWSFERGMVIQAYLFLVGFAFPLAWWIGVLLPVTSRNKGKGKDVETGEKGKNPAPTVGVVDRSNSGLWTDVTPYDEEQKRLWRGRCLIAGVIGTIFWVVVIVCAVVFSRR